MNDPLYGIPDTNIPGLASIRLARALSGPDRPGHRHWRRTYAVMALVFSLAGLFLGLVQLWRQ